MDWQMEIKVEVEYVAGWVAGEADGWSVERKVGWVEEWVGVGQIGVWTTW